MWPLRRTTTPAGPPPNVDRRSCIRFVLVYAETLVIVEAVAKTGRNWRKIPWYLRYRKGAMWASGLRRLSIMATHRHCRVEFQGPVRLGPGFTLDIPDQGTFIVGPGVNFR